MGGGLKPLQSQSLSLPRADKVAHKARILAIMPDNLNPIPRAHTSKGKSQPIHMHTAHTKRTEDRGRGRKEKEKKE